MSEYDLRHHYETNHNKKYNQYTEKMNDEKLMNFNERTKISKLFKVNKINKVNTGTVQCPMYEVKILQALKCFAGVQLTFF